MSKAREFGFNVENIDVFRDFVQGLYGNRIPLDAKGTLSYIEKLNNLANEQAENSIVNFSSFEMGGAQPQVDSVFRGKDAFETMRQVRAGYNGIIRPLERAVNVFMLEPRPYEEIYHVLKEVAESVAGLHINNAEKRELLRFKIFDSQAVSSEVEPVLLAIQKLREEGHEIGVEIAIPYSDGTELGEENPYTDDFYLSKSREALDLQKKFAIPDNLFRISLKDMVGEMDGSNATRLTGAIIDLLKRENAEISFGLHCHDTGLATEAYVAAIKVAKDKNWPIAIDTVNSERTIEANSAEKKYKVTGFSSLLDVHRALEAEGFNDNAGLGFSDAQITLMNEAGKISDDLADEYSVRRVNSDISGTDLRKYKIPGGGFASFMEAARAAQFATKLGLSEEEAANVAGTALITVGGIMGHPFAVTPGFQNKQISAFHLLNKMIETGVISDALSFADIINTVESIFKEGTDNEINNKINTLFLKDIPVKISNFLAGEMPAEAKIDKNPQNEEVKEQFAKKITRVHPSIRVAIPRKNKKEELTSRYPHILESAKELHELGMIKPTPIQLINALQFLKVTEKDAISAITSAFAKENITSPEVNGKEDKNWLEKAKRVIANQPAIKDLSDALITRLSARAIHTAAARGIILEASGSTLEQAVRQPWRREPDASEYKSLDEYNRAVQRTKNDLSPIPDATEEIRKQHFQRQITTNQARKTLTTLAEEERQTIHNSVLLYMQKNTNVISDIITNLSKKTHASDGTENDPLIKVINEIYAVISEEIRAKHYNGQQFLFSPSERMDIAFKQLSRVVSSLASKDTNVVKHVYKNTYGLTKKVKTDIENSAIRTSTPGKIIAINPALQVAEAAIKKGDWLYTIEIMKMEVKVSAMKANEGIIKNFFVNVGDFLASGQSVIEMQITPEQQAIKDRIASYKPNEENSAQTTKVSDYINSQITPIPANENIETNKLEEKESKLEKLASSDLEEKEASFTLNSRGYNAPATSATSEIDSVIHVVMNRGGCAAKIGGDLEQRGNDVRYMYNSGDKTTPIIAKANPEKLIEINGYMDETSIIKAAKKLAAENKDKIIALHPGWGFLSEKDNFVAKIEKLNPQILFIGPNSKSMNDAGGKKSLRDIIEVVKSEYNPKYLGNAQTSSGDLEAYIDYLNGAEEAQLHILDKQYRAEFASVLAMGGDVMIKAVYGGGGRGITPFTNNKTIDPEANYKIYLGKLLETTVNASKLFNNSELMTEQRIRGKAHHVEVQFAATNGASICLGARNCTAQLAGQKLAEINLINGDYSSELIAKINEAGILISGSLAKNGYAGLGTLEMMVIPKTGEVKVLEVNTRLQVEHQVTEWDAFIKTEKRLSLPVLNYALVNNTGGLSPIAILEQISGITADDLEKLNTPGDKRVLHVRVNSKEMDLISGKVSASFIKDVMWPTFISSDVVKETKSETKNDITFIQGGLGDATKDPQIGAIAGPELAVRCALGKFMGFLEITRIYGRKYPKQDALDRTNLQPTLEIYNQLMFKSDGTINPEFSTSTIDEILEDIQHDAAAGANTSAVRILPGQKHLRPDYLGEVFGRHTQTLQEEVRECKGDRAVS